MANPVLSRSNTEQSSAASQQSQRNDKQDPLSLVDTISKQHQKLYASSFAASDLSQIDVKNFPTYKDTDFWEPALRKMRGFGMVHSEKFAWPNNSLIKDLDLNQVIKLCGIELGMTSNLFEMRLLFSGGLRSPMLKAEGAGINANG